MKQTFEALGDFMRLADVEPTTGLSQSPKRKKAFRKNVLKKRLRAKR